MNDKNEEKVVTNQSKNNKRRRFRPKNKPKQDGETTEQTYLQQSRLKPKRTLSQKVKILVQKSKEITKIKTKLAKTISQKSKNSKKKSQNKSQKLKPKTRQKSKKRSQKRLKNQKKIYPQS